MDTVSQQNCAGRTIMLKDSVVPNRLHGTRTCRFVPDIKLLYWLKEAVVGHIQWSVHYAPRECT